MKTWGSAQRRKLNIALLLLLIAALLALAGVLLLRTRPDAVSPDNRIETAEKLSLPMSRTALFRALNGEGGLDAVRLDAEVTLPGAQEAMGMSQMLPGDSTEKTFNVNVRHDSGVNLYFSASLRNDGAVTRPDGTESTLSAGMLITVTQGSEQLYSGTIAGLAGSSLKAVNLPGSGSRDLPYTIRVELPTSAGNEFQGKSLTVDLKWWIESDGTGGGGGGGGTVIVTPPKTGDDFSLVLTAGAAALALTLLVVLWSRRRRARHD